MEADYLSLSFCDFQFPIRTPRPLLLDYTRRDLLAASFTYSIITYAPAETIVLFHAIIEICILRMHIIMIV